MKKTRKLIPAIAMLLTSTVMMSTASFAWFSINKTVEVTGMNVTASAQGSLVINSAYGSGLGMNRNVSFTTSNDVTLSPITYNFTPDTTDDADAKTYVYCNNASLVDPNTGLAMSGETLTYAAVTAASGYYVDYVVYLSAAGQEIQNATISATLVFDSTNMPTLNQRATTVAFTVGDAVSAEVSTPYAVATAPTGTINASTITGTTYTVSANIATGKTIPLYNATTGNTSIPVLMRVYFDGALEESSGKTWVRSEEITQTKLTFGVEFRAT